jgi:hypothetical protein
VVNLTQAEWYESLQVADDDADAGDVLRVFGTLDLEDDGNVVLATDAIDVRGGTEDALLEGTLTTTPTAAVHLSGEDQVFADLEVTQPASGNVPVIGLDGSSGVHLSNLQVTETGDPTHGMPVIGTIDFGVPTIDPTITDVISSGTIGAVIEGSDLVTILDNEIEGLADDASDAIWLSGDADSALVTGNVVADGAVDAEDDEFGFAQRNGEIDQINGLPTGDTTTNEAVAQDLCATNDGLEQVFIGGDAIECTDGVT